MLEEMKTGIEAARLTSETAATAVLNFKNKIVAVESDFATSSETLRSLETRRAELLAGIGSGARNEGVFSKLRKNQGNQCDHHEDLKEVLVALRAGLILAEKDEAVAKKEYEKIERSAWRKVAAALVEQHKGELQIIFSRLHCCEQLSKSPGGIDSGLRLSPMPSILHDLMQIPQSDEVAEIKGKLLKEYF